MDFYSKVSKLFSDFFESDDITDMVMKREYFNVPVYTGIYPKMTKKYRVYPIFQFFVNVAVSLFHMYVISINLAIYSKLNFTLLSFMFQIYLLIQYCLLILFIFTIKRPVMRSIHRDMIGKFFVYEGEDHEAILEKLKKNLKREKKMFLALIFFMCFVGFNTVILAPVLDTRYGSFNFNASDYDIVMETPLKGWYPFDMQESTKLFYIYPLTFLQLLSAIFIVGTIASAGLCFTFVCFYYLMHVRYLIINFKNIEIRAETLFNKQYEKNVVNTKDALYEDERFLQCFELCLKINIKHHQMILT